MGFKEQVLTIMEHANWKIGSVHHINAIRRYVMEQLNVSDRRTVNKWSGKSIVEWKKQGRPIPKKSRGGTPYVKYIHKKTLVWKKGLLEDFGIIETRNDKTNSFREAKILKDKTNFPQVKPKTKRR
jgi:hypothetical protein